MATYSLSGTGSQALSTGVVAFHITITTLPVAAGHGLASPVDYYGVGYLRPGDGTGFWDAYPICGGPQWMPVPNGATTLSYVLLGGAVVSVVEVFAPAPLGFPLASLPDVALASPADAQVLSYHALTSQWINSTPTGGGTTLPASHMVQMTSNVQTGGAQVWLDVLTLSLPAGTWLLTGQLTIAGMNNTFWVARLWDGTSVFSAGMNNVIAGNWQTLTLTALVRPTTTTTYRLAGMAQFAAQYFVGNASSYIPTNVATTFTAVAFGS